MAENAAESPLNLSVLLTVVSGVDSLDRCLQALIPQVQAANGEIIVPIDEFCADVKSMEARYPTVQFHWIDDLGVASCADIPAHKHRLFDRRRACGLSRVRGRIVAMTEDHAVPAEDWCARILEAHKQPYAVIGGPIDNEIDKPLNWAWYYCDFGRYGSPIEAGPRDYVSDVNISYKRTALEAVRDTWCVAYHETNVHWALQARGEVLFIDPSIVVFQHRPQQSFGSALRERLEWGRIFAETRVRECSSLRRLTFLLGAPVLPMLLSWRAFRHMIRQGRTIGQIFRAFPLIAALLSAWSCGEFVGYVCQPVDEHRLSGVQGGQQDTTTG